MVSFPNGIQTHAPWERARLGGFWTGFIYRAAQRVDPPGYMAFQFAMHYAAFAV